MYKFKCEDRNYSKYGFIDAKQLSDTYIELNVDPLKNKLFNQDIFDYNGDKLTILHSSIRSMKNIPGVIILLGNKTYGKIKNKLLYRCVPDDKRLPEFLVGYKIRNNFENSTF